MIRALAVAGTLLVVPATALGQGEASAELELRADALELGLAHVYYSVDFVDVVAAMRSTVTGAYESYCALDFLLPDGDGYDGVEIGVGLGCLTGAVTLFVLSAFRFAAIMDTGEEGARLRRFRQARRDGTSEETLSLFEAELGDEADSGTVRRILGAAFGAASLVASGILTALVVADVVDPAAGISIAAGTGVTGLMSLSVLFFESPAERAWNRYREATSP